jgi:hypothetical protein
MSDFDNIPRVKKVHEKEDCKGCEELIREDERVKVSNRFLIEMDEMLESKFIKFEYKKVRQLSDRMAYIFLAVIVLSGGLLSLWFYVHGLAQELHQHLNK